MLELLQLSVKGKKANLLSKIAERGRIRTSDAALNRITALASRCLKPLSHLSKKRVIQSIVFLRQFLPRDEGFMGNVPSQKWDEFQGHIQASSYSVLSI